MFPVNIPIIRARYVYCLSIKSLRMSYTLYFIHFQWNYKILVEIQHHPGPILSQVVVRGGVRSWSREALIMDQFRGVGGSQLFYLPGFLRGNIWRPIGSKPILLLAAQQKKMESESVQWQPLTLDWIPPVEKVQVPSRLVSYKADWI